MGAGALALQREGFTRYAATGQHNGEPLFRLTLACTSLDQGLVPEAREELARGLEFVERSGEARSLAEVLWLPAACLVPAMDGEKTAAPSSTPQSEAG